MSRRGYYAFRAIQSKAIAAVLGLAAPGIDSSRLASHNSLLGDPRGLLC